MPVIPERIQNPDPRYVTKRLNDQTPRNDINRLQNENNKLESELHLTLEEIAHLQNALANANMKLTVYKNSSKKALAAEKKEIDTITEELKEIYIPLNTITKYCELLLSESIGILGTIQQKFVERIIDSSLQIRELLDGFQKNAIVQELTLQPEGRTYDLHTLLEEVLEKNAALLQQKQIVLQMEVPDELPKVTGTRNDLTNILETVILNALKITPNDGSVCITAFRVKILTIEKVILKVRDGGPGIPANELKRLFPYKRESTSDEIPGMAMKSIEFNQFIDCVQKVGCKFKLGNAIGFGSTIELTFDCLI